MEIKEHVRALEESRKNPLSHGVQRGGEIEGTPETSERARVKFEALKTMIEVAISRNRDRARRWGGPQAFINDLKSI